MTLWLLLPPNIRPRVQALRWATGNQCQQDLLSPSATYPLSQQSKGRQLRIEHRWFQMNLTPSWISWRDCTRHYTLAIALSITTPAGEIVADLPGYFPFSYPPNNKSLDCCVRVKIKGQTELKIAKTGWEVSRCLGEKRRERAYVCMLNLPCPLGPSNCYSEVLSCSSSRHLYSQGQTIWRARPHLDSRRRLVQPPVVLPCGGHPH